MRNTSPGLIFAAELEPACVEVAGAKIYRAQCTICHGAKGKGDGPAAAGLKPRPSDLSDAVLMAKLSDDSLVKVLTGGRKAMPGFGKILKPEDVRRVAAFVRCLGKSEGAGNTSGN
jgi:mono/diheme cytochrome c family protein